MIGPVWPGHGLGVIWHTSLAPPPLPLIKTSASVTGTRVGPVLGASGANITGCPVTVSQLAGDVEAVAESDSAGWFNRNATTARGGWISVVNCTRAVSPDGSSPTCPQSNTHRPSTQTRSLTDGQTNSGNAPHMRS